MDPPGSFRPEEISVTAEQLRRAIFNRWPLILIALLVSIVAAAAATFSVPPTYSSTCTILVTLGPDPRIRMDGTLVTGAINTVDQFALSRPVLADVASHYDGLTPEALRSRVTAASVSNSLLLQITALDRSPTRAAAIANDVAAAAIAQYQEAQKTINDFEMAPVQADIDATQSQIASLKARLAQLPNTQSNTSARTALVTQLSFLDKELSSLQFTLTGIQRQQVDDTISITVASAAEPSSTPASPILLLNIAAAAAFGALLGLLLVAIAQTRNYRVNTIRQLEQLVPWTVFTMDVAADAATHAPRERNDRAGAPASSAVDGRAAQLRTQVRLLSIARPVNSIAVTAASPDTAAIDVTTTLAHAFQREGDKVLLVDADLRRESGLSVEPDTVPTPSEGLTTAVLAIHGGADARETVSRFLQSSAASATELRLVPRGPDAPNPHEVLASGAMAQFFAAVMQIPGVTALFSVPAVDRYADGRELLAHVDGVLMVVDLATARRRGLTQAVAQLTNSKAHVLGVCALTGPARRQHQAQSSSGSDRVVVSDAPEARALSKEATVNGA
jgi:non-specific protein-tyrosine kinase